MHSQAETQLHRHIKTLMDMCILRWKSNTTADGSQRSALTDRLSAVILISNL